MVDLENIDYSSALDMRVKRAQGETGNSDLLGNVISARTKAVRGGEIATVNQDRLITETGTLKSWALKNVVVGLIMQNPPRKSREEQTS